MNRGRHHIRISATFSSERPFIYHNRKMGGVKGGNLLFTRFFLWFVQ